MKKILFPLKIQFTVDKNKETGKLVIQSARIKFNCIIDEYPELPAMKLLNKMKLSPEEEAEILTLCKAILKKHMEIKDG